MFYIPINCTLIITLPIKFSIKILSTCKKPSININIASYIRFNSNLNLNSNVLKNYKSKKT